MPEAGATGRQRASRNSPGVGLRGLAGRDQEGLTWPLTRPPPPRSLGRCPRLALGCVLSTYWTSRGPGHFSRDLQRWERLRGSS